MEIDLGRVSPAPPHPLKLHWKALYATDSNSSAYKYPVVCGKSLGSHYGNNIHFYIITSVE